MKIAIFTDSYRPYVSGVVRSIETFTREFLDMGHGVYVFAPRYYRDANGRPTLSLQEERYSEDFRVFRYWSLPVPMYAGFVLPVPISPHVDHVIRRLKVDVIHSHTPFLMGRLGAAVARRQGLPLVFTHHTMYHEYVHYVPGIRTIARRVVLRHLARYCRRAQLVVAPTPQIQQFVAETYRLKGDVVAIPTGIDLDAFARADRGWLRRTYGIAPEARVLIFVGRLGREKNVDLLLDAFARVAAARDDVVLVMVGDGPERMRLQTAVEGLGLAGRVIFTGTLDKPRVIDAYAGSDVFFFASVTETQGLVTLEAMAAGLPVAAVDAPGTRDMVRHGREGLLAERSAASLARQALAVLENEPLRQQLSRGALARAAQFGARRQAEAMLAAYEAVLTPGSVPRTRGPHPVDWKQEYSS